MDDIVTRLRERCSGQGRTREVISDAADEIERLRFERDGHRDAARAYKDEIERLRQSVIEMRQLLDKFWKTCTEEHNSVEMFVLHRATGHAIARAYDAVPEEARDG